MERSGRHCDCDVSHMIWGVRDFLTEVTEHDFTCSAAPGDESYDFPWKGSLGLDNLDSPDTGYIIPHLPCGCKKKSLQETFIFWVFNI